MEESIKTLQTDKGRMRLLAQRSLGKLNSTKLYAFSHSQIQVIAFETRAIPFDWRAGFGVVQKVERNHRS